MIGTKRAEPDDMLSLRTVKDKDLNHGMRFLPVLATDGIQAILRLGAAFHLCW